MGSASSSLQKKPTDPIKIPSRQKLPSISNSHNNNPNQQFTNSVEQMKFSKRNDLFKQRSKQTILELNQALQNLKQNRLLSTLEFKKLQKTQQVVSHKPNTNQLFKQRYHNKKAPSKRSQLAVREKRAESSIEVSSVSSKYMNQPMLLGKQQEEIAQIKLPNPSNKISSIIIKRQNHTLSQNAYRKPQNHQLINHMKLIQQTPILDQDNQQQILQPKRIEMKRRKTKSVKSEQFRLNRLKHSDGLDEIAVIQDADE